MVTETDERIVAVAKLAEKDEPEEGPEGDAEEISEADLVLDESEE
jgi:hypothetical protein